MGDTLWQGLLAFAGIVAVSLIIAVLLWSFIHVIRNRELSVVQKILWLIVMLCAFPWGSILYYCLTRPKYAGVVAASRRHSA